MNAKPNDNEIVRAKRAFVDLRYAAENCDRTNAGCQWRKHLLDAAALIESQAAEIKRYSDTGLTPEEITANMEMFAAYRRVCGGKSPEEVAQMYAENARLRAERDKAVEDMKVGWLCRACIKRVKGKEWCNCPALNFVNGPEKTTTCDNFEWRGTEGKRDE